MKTFLCRSLLALTLQASAPATLTVPLERASATVEFFAVGWPSALKIHGRGSGLHGRLALAGSSVSGRVSFDLAVLDTGIGLRNRHMKDEYLETGRFPQATLNLSPLDLGDAAARPTFNSRRLPFKGVLDLHGVARPVSGDANIGRDASGVTVEAAFELRTTDFGIRTPSYLGITVAEQVKVKVRFSAPVEGSSNAAGDR